jgi:hypothetical protein
MRPTNFPNSTGPLWLALGLVVAPVATPVWDAAADEVCPVVLPTGAPQVSHRLAPALTLLPQLVQNIAVSQGKILTSFARQLLFNHLQANVSARGSQHLHLLSLATLKRG